MWKHEIMASLIGLKNGPLPAATDIGRQLVECLDYEIEKAIAIHCGQIQSYENILKNSTNLLSYDFDRLLPYNRVLLEYFIGDYYAGAESANVKRALLIDNANDSLLFVPIAHLPIVSGTKNRWQPEFTAFSFSKKDKKFLYIPLANMNKTSPLANQQLNYNEILLAANIFTILSCKNVSLTPVDPPERLNKSRIKKGKPPLLRYHVLTLDLNQGRRLAGKAANNKLGTMPVHLCRGHFKEYTEDKPLFGRVTGRFWWQPYARGQSKNGVVMKDYAIKGDS